MTPRTIGILHPGEMGSAVGRVLREHGLRVICALEERSARTRGLAAQAGLEDVGSLSRLAAQSDLVLSILVPAQALNQARAFADVARNTRRAGGPPVYADCNAISMEMMREIAAALAAAGCGCVDAGIIGPPPRKMEPGKPGTTRVYASAPDELALGQFTALGQYGLDVRPAGRRIGQASLLKTCYASVTKGLSALAAIQLTAAEQAGLSETLRAELELSQPALWPWMNRVVPGMPPKAHRWIGEMEEHARSFRELGLPPEMMTGAAELYRLVAASPAGSEGVESDRLALEQMARLLAAHLRAR
jgi:3-hydroxyisobutyrate dehydrogenase-like beta-hydroxyacid dehydrogenase